MKSLILLCITCMFSFSVMAQEAMILPSNETFSLGTQSAYIIEIEELSFEEAADVWVDYTKDQKAKAKKTKSGEYLSDDIEIAGISDNSIDLYSVFEKVESDSKAKFWFDMGGAYFSDDQFPDRVAAQRSFLAGYIRMLESAKIDKEVSKLEDELKSSAKDNKKIKKDISKLSKKNAKLQKELQENETDLEKLTEKYKGIDSTNKSKKEKIKEMKETSKSIRN